MPTIIGQRRQRSAEIVSNDGKIDYSTTLVYIVYDDQGGASEAQILLTPGLPVTNEPISLPGVPYQCACKSKKCDQWESNARYWNVTCEIVNTEISVWIPPTGGGGGGGGSGGSGGGENDSDDPESWTPQVTLSFEQEEEALLSDVYGYAIVNTAERRYAQPLIRKRLIPTWKFTQYENISLTIDQLMARHETVNSTEYKDKPIGTWMLLVDGCDSGIRNGKKVWKVSYCLKYRSRTWNQVYFRDSTGAVVAASPNSQTGWQPVLMQIDSHDKNLNPLLDKKKNYTEDFLNANGTQLYNRDNNENGPPIFLLHTIYPAIDFDFLRI
jgi:hypothetical protein